jgi:recombination DNA repair RAD52 pathway protein
MHRPDAHSQAQGTERAPTNPGLEMVDMPDRSAMSSVAKLAAQATTYASRTSRGSWLQSSSIRPSAGIDESKCIPSQSIAHSMCSLPERLQSGS